MTLPVSDVINVSISMATINSKASISPDGGDGAIVVGVSLRQIIKQMFAGGEQGFAFDVNDLSTLFQDAAGTLPVTAVGQPVGLILDKSKGLTLGTELFVDQAAAVENGAGGAVITTDLAARSLTIVTAGTVNGYPRISVNVGMEVGKRYVVRGKIIGDGVVNGVRLATSGSINQLTHSAETGEFYGVQIAASPYLNVLINGTQTGTLTISDISIIELKGNHAYQNTSASRPLLQRNATTGAYYLAFDGVDDSLVTNNIDLSFTDKFSLFAGLRKLNETTATICEFGPSPNSTNGTFGLLSATGTNNIALRCRGSGTPNSFADSSASNLLSPVSAVLTGKIIGQATNTSSLRSNGQTYLPPTDAGASNFANQSLNIGRRNNTSLPFSGHVYNLIGVSRLATDIEIAAMEKALAKRLGVTLS